MTIKNRIQRVFKALMLCLLFASSPVLAQNNMLPNNVSNFNIGTVGNGHSGNNLSNVGVATQYHYVKTHNGLINDTATQCYAVGTDARWYCEGHNNVLGDYGMFSIGDHTTGNGNYMIINGSTLSNKKVWEYTVQNITPGVIYQFKAYVTCLFMTPYGTSPTNNYLPKLQLKINDQNVGPEKTIQWTNGGQWVSWSQDWTAGDNITSAKITIINNCTNNNGNDFGLDDIVFKMKSGYSLTAEDFTASFCGETTPIEPIDLSGHYTMTAPENDNSGPMQVKIKQSNGAPSWGTECDTYYGNFHAMVGSDNKIYLTLNNPNFHGTDYVRYQISRFGLPPTDNKITINFFDLPSNCNPQGLPPNGLLCISDVSSFNPSATWEANGSGITLSNWEFKSDVMDYWEPGGNFQYFAGIGGYSIRFFAENSCGRQHSDPYNFNICGVPEWITQPTVTTICTGSAEPTVSINWNYNTGVQTWQYKRDNGNWTDFVWGSFDLQPGDQVRYRVTYNACSGNPLTSQTINVVSGPQFNTSIPVSFEEGYCPGSPVTLPQIQTSWYNAYGMSVTSGWYYVNYDPSGSPSYVPITGNTITLNNVSVSVTPCLQNTECGFTPFFPAFDLVVWDEPAILGELPDSLGPVCSGTPLSSILPALSPDGHYTEFGWEISAGQNPSGYQSNLPQTLSLTDNGRWLRYRVDGCPQYNPITSDPVRLWVGGAPTLNTNQINPLGTVCEGTSIASLVDVHVTNWNLYDDPDESFERWEVLLNGTWTEFTQFELNHNGCQVRYHAHNYCGDAPFVSAGVVNVTEGPSFNNPGASLGFEAYYCDGNTLNLPTPPEYDEHGVSVYNPHWVYFDGVDYHILSAPTTVNESWNGYQITYVLESDCGGEIYYPNPYTLTIKGNPEVEISMSGSTTFCVDTPIALDAEIDWHLCTENAQASSWLFAPLDQPNNYSNFNPNAGIPVAGTFYINYHAVANECGFEAYDSNPIRVTVEAAPAFENAGPFVSDHFCEGDVLQLPNLNITGHVDYAGWQISADLDPDGEYTDVVPGYVLANEDNGRWLRYYATGCYVSIYSEEEEIHVDGKPFEEYDIEERICKGQMLSYQLIDSNGYPVTQTEWRLGSTSGDSFNPDGYTFDAEGDYLIYYRVGNDCGWSDFVGPLSLSVTAGPEFDNSTLPTGPQYVCEGKTVEEFLLEHNITPPPLVDPSISPDTLGWFINDQPVELSTVIVEEYHNAGLRYGVKGNCSDVPVYSRGILLYVYGRPKVTQMPTMDWEFCDGEPVQLPDPEIDFHHGDGHVQGYWQMQSPDGSWGNLPTSWSADHNGVQVRYHLEHMVCSNLDNDSGEVTISVFSAPIINDADLPMNNVITICTGDPLGIAEPDVQPVQNVSGWQVSADGTNWSTVLEGHTFNPDYVDNYFDGKYLRYHAESTRCPNLEDNSIVYTIQLINSPTINDANWPTTVQYCSGGSLGIAPSGLPGEWQVSANGTDWGTVLDGYDFDEDHIDDYFDGKFVRYYVHSSCGDAESKVITLRLMAAINMPIIGETQVAMMNSFWPGIYDYYIDSTNLVQPVVWSLEGADWRLDTLGMARCLVYVSSIGTAVLHARFTNELCSNEVEVLLPINATYFGVGEYDAVEVTIYPNPTRNTVTIEAEGIERIRLINMMGQVLEIREYGELDSAVFNLSGYKPSVYLLEIKTINGVAKKRLILYR